MGGNLNANRNGATAVKIAHAKNVTLKGVTVRNTINAHLVEVAGVDGMKFEKCTFKDQVQSKKAKVLTPEAIQIDVLVKRHMPGYRSQDLPMRNVVVNKCTFSNVPRGVGSHTAIVNNPVDTIAITNNKFTKIKSTAIQGMNYKNCTISGNTIKSAPRGIALYSIFSKGTFLATTPVKEGKVKTKTSSKYIAPLADQNIVISNNKITVKGTDSISTYTNEGILVSGLEMEKKKKRTADQDAIPKGNYYLSGVTVANNTISSNGNGIRLCDVRNASLNANSISYTGKATSKTPYHGIHLTLASKDVSVANNTMKSSQSNGAYVNRGCDNVTIRSNKIAAPGKYGVGIEGSSALLVSDNVISSPRSAGIFVYDGGSVKTVERNAIQASKGSGIQAAKNSTIDAVEGNTVSAVASCGVMTSDRSTISRIAGNRIEKTGKPGIGLYSARGNGAIVNNTITGAASYGIYIDTQSTSAVITVQGNVLAGSGNATRVKAASGSKVVLS